MTDGLDLVAEELTAGDIESVELGIRLNTHAVLVIIVKARSVWITTCLVLKVLSIVR